MKNSDIKRLLYSSTNCTTEEAVMYLLGFPQSQIQAYWMQYSDDPSDGEWLCSEGHDYLEDELEQAESDLAEAKLDKASGEIIADKQAELNRCKDQMGRAHAYRHAIDHELVKGDNSRLLLDKLATETAGYRRISLLSLKNWAHEVLQISILGELDIGKPPKPAPRITDQEGDISIGEKSKIASPPAIPVLRKLQRRDALRIEIEDILKTAPHSTASEVMAKLRAKVGSFNTCIVGNTGEGLKWENDKGDEKIITIEALSERIRNLKKPE